MSKVYRVYASLLSSAFEAVGDGVIRTTVPVSAQSVVDRIQADVDPMSLVGEAGASASAEDVNLGVGEEFKFRASNPIVVTTNPDGSARAKLAYLVKAS